MEDKIKELIKNLKYGVSLLEQEPKSEFTDGQIEMTKNIIFELQKIKLGLKN